MALMPPKITYTEADFVSKLLLSRENAHILHWRTDCFSYHKALEDYYTGIVDLIDQLVEVWQGKNNKIMSGFKVSGAIQEEHPAEYLQGVKSFVDSNRNIMGSERHIQAIIDEIEMLLDRTIYKLTFLD